MSTATAVVNNTMFTRRNAIVAAVGRATNQTEVLGEPTLEVCQSSHQREADD